MSGPTLFLHSFGLDGRASHWLTTRPDLSPTLPHHGMRRRRRAGLSLADMVDEITGWVREPVHVVGCSVGGMVALHLALAHPALVRSLLLTCTAASVPRETILARADETRTTTQAEFVSSTMQRWFTRAALDGAPREPIAFARQCLEDADREALADVWTAVAEHDVRDALSAIVAPTTVVGATMDVSAPLEKSRELHDGIPGSRLRLIDSAHMAYLERPAEFAALVEEHLSWAP